METFIFTDGEDGLLRLRAGDHVINTNCWAVHRRQALCCKMSVEYQKFIESGRKWFCHVDDNYVNPRGLLRLLSAFSPSQNVYLGRPSLENPIETAHRLRGDGADNSNNISCTLFLHEKACLNMGQFTFHEVKLLHSESCHTLGPDRSMPFRGPELSPGSEEKTVRRLNPLGA
ncbi:beta-1,3-N-acetylglucosaminyltransferase radical fringe-like [Tachyglossus aculeatus]|uniref:beta-1,3-N-acetylglucosaminyltransferase radical fringe-like n=1 Tax=Tachyglossus aculeatus TaxID=9261 RepID=UPI0018F78C6C|nr:beta-1,3-N-acetylglucosaminyltransferase radical fringe-like [Tachyglossus aculeatus]